MKKNRNNGFTLTELIVCLSIFILLLTFYLTSLNQLRERIKVGKTQAAITQYVYLLEVVKEDVNWYPPAINNTLESLAYSTAPAGYEKEWRGPYLKEIPIDPWKTSYFYRLKGGTFLPRWTVFRNSPTSQDSLLTFDAKEYGGWGGTITILNTKTNGTANRVYLNNVEIVHPNEFKQQVYEIQKDVSFFPSGTPNVIRVTLLGNPHSEINIDIGSYRHPRTTYSVGSYGADKQPAGTGFAKDLTWITKQSETDF